jgi:ribosome-binding factor A
METKFTPRLRFEVDRTFETASYMADLLNDPHIKQDLG